MVFEKLAAEISDSRKENIKYYAAYWQADLKKQQESLSVNGALSSVLNQWKADY